MTVVITVTLAACGLAVISLGSNIERYAWSGRLDPKYLDSAASSVY